MEIKFKKILRTFTIILIAYGILPLIVLPLFFLVICPMYFFRLLISKCVCFFEKDLASLVPSRNCILAAESHFEKRPLKNLIVLLRLRGESKALLTKETLGDLLSKCVFKKEGDCGNGDGNEKLLYPQLQQFYVSRMGFLFWKWDQQFRIENHFKDITASIQTISDKNKSADDLVTEQQLQELTVKLIHSPFPPQRSPWEFLLVRNCQPAKKETENHEKSEKSEKSESVLILRLHHGLADGYATTNFILDTLQQNLIETKLATPSKLTRGTNSSMLKFCTQNVLKFSKLCFLAPYETLNQLFDGPDRNIWHNSESRNKLSGGALNKGKSTAIPVSLIKEIKDIHRVNFHSVILAAIAGAVRRSMEMSSAIAPLPSYVTCGMPLPVPRNSKRLGNYVSGTFIKLPVGISNPIERLKSVEANLKNLKNSTIPVVNLITLRLLGILPTFLINKMTRNNFSTLLATNFYVSNYPILVQISNYLDFEVTDVSVAAGFGAGSVGLGLSVISYNGWIHYMAGVDGSIMDAQECTFFIKYIEDEINILRDQLL